MNKLLLIPIFATILLSGCTMNPTSTTTSTTTTTSTLSMITIYCVNVNCSPAQIELGAGTLAQGCYRNQNDCLATQSTSAPAPQATVTIQNFAFSPNNLTVNIGNTVAWTNLDSVTHTIVSDSGNELNSGSIAQGQSFSHTFAKAGVYSYHCGIHPSMKATITVQ